ncbi:hypothetical protein B0H15DRAFT_945981 [Mycena belliarum]|uniref:G domain-containing protein n=1 Tax=Mycena belliarum TaxID=1033014 RepID=A0AAD6UCK7_9AGAR|nr:hypothetical protein B0H15DRAFT_945981 [Mycena belliae]
MTTLPLVLYSPPVDVGHSVRRVQNVVVPDEKLIAVMGPTGSGKTSFINLVSGSDLRVGRGLQSCTSTVQVTMIDTPGFDDTSKSDTDILTLIAAFLAKTYEATKKLAGIIYMHRISDIRMGGISTRNFKMFRQSGEVGLEVGEAREAELASNDQFFKPAILHYLTRNQPRALRIQRELVDQGKDISQTAAGAELNRELDEQIQRHKEEMENLQKEMQDAIQARDEETKKDLKIEFVKVKNELSRVLAGQADFVRMTESSFSALKAEQGKWMEERAAELDAAKRDAELARREAAEDAFWKMVGMVGVLGANILKELDEDSD